MIIHPKWDSTHVAQNLSARKKDPILIVLHHTGGHLTGDLATLCAKGGKKVSADFEIARDGTIFKLNPQLSTNYTWQAGVSEWHGRKNVNPFSFGVEQEHMPGDSWPEAQIEATAEVCAYLCIRFGIDRLNIASHATVARPVGRKVDPENYPWRMFQDALKAVYTRINK